MMVATFSKLTKKARTYRQLRDEIDKMNRRLVETYKTKENPRKIALELEKLLSREVYEKADVESLQNTLQEWIKDFDKWFDPLLIPLKDVIEGNRLREQFFKILGLGKPKPEAKTQ